MPKDWNRIAAAGGWVGVIVADANFESATQLQWNLHNAPTTQPPQLIYGYVNTSNGGESKGTVNQHVRNWYTAYGPSTVQGIFFDVGPTYDPGAFKNDTVKVTQGWDNGVFPPDPTTGQRPATISFRNNPTFAGYQDYYGYLYSQVHQNFSWDVMVNAPQWPEEWIVSGTTGPGQGADRVLLWEESLAAYLNHWGAMPCGTSSTDAPCIGNVTAAPAWWSAPAYTGNYDIGNTVFHVSQTGLSNTMAYSWTPTQNRTASLVYLYDRPQGTYNGVPCYFEQEVNALGGGLSGPNSTWCGSCSGNTCTGSCHDLTQDSLNCGTCGNPCGAGTTCQNGACAPPPCVPITCNDVSCGIVDNGCGQTLNCGRCGL